MNATAEQLPRIALTSLRLSPLNARKTTTHGVEDLAASIEAHGLLQNLTVTPAANGEGYEVVAGGRRLAAMQLLQRERRLPESLSHGLIPCLVITDADVAHEASTAENTLREAMHPADQFDAFKAMVDGGKPIVDVAAHFGVTERVVRQRLKLANVDPQLVQIYRDDSMDLEQLQALAITDDHEAQRKAWFGPKYDHERSAWNLRHALTDRDVHANSPLARFVGLDVYEAEGGAFRRDLFSDRDEAWLTDRKLLQRLADARLEDAAQQVRAEGWSWVDVQHALDYEQLAAHPKYPCEPEPRPLTADEQQRMDAIQYRIRVIEKILDEKEEFDEEASELEDEAGELSEEAEEITEQAVTWPAHATAAAGAIVTLHNGTLRIERARLKPGQRASTTGEVTGKTKPAPGEKAKPKKPELSAAILMALSAHRSEVARYHLARDPQIALALQVDFLISALKHDHSSVGVLRLGTNSRRDATQIAPDIHKALASTDDLPFAVAVKKIPKAGRLAWLIKQPQADLLQMFAYLLAQQFDGITESPNGHDGVAQLHAAIGFNMADHWNPTCDGFLSRIPTALAIEAVAEAKSKPAAAALAGLKKDALVAEAAKQLAGTGYLPKPLRGPGYALRGESKATPAKKAAKAPAKKAAKKPTAERRAKAKGGAAK